MNKKVLLRERKRHTARRVAYARYAGVWWGGRGYPIQSWWGGGYPIQYNIRPGMGYPHHPDLAGYPPPSRPGWGPPPPPPSRPGWGTSPPPRTLDGVPPSRPGWGTPHHLDLDGVTPPHHPDLDAVPPPPHHTDLDAVPPPPSTNVNRQTPVKTVPSRRTTYAGGKK